MEAMLLGIWKNVEELENNITLNELEGILGAARDREHRHNKFTAALKGIDLDKGTAEDAKARFEAIKQRAEARTSGKTQNEIELNSLGLDFG